MEYDRDGDFGRVRLIAHSPSVLARRLYYCVQSAGWHFCNDRYHIERETGNDNCLLLCTIGGRGVLEYGGSIYQLQPGSVAVPIPTGRRKADSGNFTGFTFPVQALKNLQSISGRKIAAYCPAR